MKLIFIAGLGHGCGIKEAAAFFTAYLSVLPGKRVGHFHCLFGKAAINTVLNPLLNEYRRDYQNLGPWLDGFKGK